jgi:Fe2+ transport system protein B
LVCYSLLPQWVHHGNNDDVIAYLVVEEARKQQAQANIEKLHKHVGMVRWEVEAMAQTQQDRLDAQRYRLAKEEMIMFKPAGYDGMNRSRFDAVWFSDEPDLDKDLDARIAKNAAIAAKGEE